MSVSIASPARKSFLMSYTTQRRFRQDFERAQLSGNYSRLDLFKARSGRQEMSDNVAMAKVRIDKALDALGNGRDGESFSQSCVWNVVGLGATLEAWTALIRAGGAGMNADRASGILYVSLERLALHYGMLDTQQSERHWPEPSLQSWHTGFHRLH